LPGHSGDGHPEKPNDSESNDETSKQVDHSFPPVKTVLGTGGNGQSCPVSEQSAAVSDIGRSNEMPEVFCTNQESIGRSRPIIPIGLKSALLYDFLMVPAMVPRLESTPEDGVALL
jgi:hypothetical protein